MKESPNLDPSMDGLPEENVPNGESRSRPVDSHGFQSMTKERSASDQTIRSKRNCEQNFPPCPKTDTFPETFHSDFGDVTGNFSQIQHDEEW